MNIGGFTFDSEIILFIYITYHRIRILHLGGAYIRQKDREGTPSMCSNFFLTQYFMKDENLLII